MSKNYALSNFVCVSAYTEINAAFGSNFPADFFIIYFDLSNFTDSRLYRPFRDPQADF